MDALSCISLNNFSLTFFDDDTYGGPILLPCRDWISYANRKYDKQYMTPIDLDNIYTLLEERTNDLLNNKDDYCKNCPHLACMNLEPFDDKKFNRCMLSCSFYCKLRCPYCFHNGQRANNAKLASSFTKNLYKFEKNIIKNEAVKIINIEGFGDIYDNTELMKLATKWVVNHNKRLEVLTNLINYDPCLPIDVLKISWHGHSDKDKFISNLKKIPDNVNKDQLIVVFMLINDKYSHSLEDAFNNVKTYLSPSRFAVSYKPIISTSELPDIEYYEASKIDELMQKTRDLGFATFLTGDPYKHLVNYHGQYKSLLLNKEGPGAA